MRQRLRRGLATGVATMMLLTLAAWWGYVPPLASRQVFSLVLPETRAGRGEPLIVTGERDNADFLYVTFPAEGRVAFGYDRWGRGGPVSRAVAYRAGATHRLELELPSLQQVIGNPRLPPPRLRVVFDGETLLDQPIETPMRRPSRLWFGENPVGGSSCSEKFRGTITDAHGTIVAGRITQVLTVPQRLLGWLRFGYAQAALILLAGAATGASVAAAAGRRATIRPDALAARGWPARAAFLVPAAFALAAFTWLVTCGSGDVVYRDGFGDFYDFQAMSLLAGRLDVPEEAIGGEAFVHNGKYYGYFGVTPALLRVPFAAFGKGFGKLTRGMMVAGFAASLLGAQLLRREARLLADPAGASPERCWVTVIFTLNVGLGSTLLFLGSRAYVYHEAILTGVAFAVWSAWAALRWLRQPESRWWIGSLACGILSVHARPPTGFFALTLLGTVAAWLAWRDRSRWRRLMGVGALAVAGVLSFNGLSYLKFGTIDGCPLRLNVQYDAKRLARIDGKQFHLSNVPFTAYTYLVTPNLLLEPRFPWLFLNVSKPGREFPAARMDYSDRTLALPWAMTGLSLLAIFGLGQACLRRTASGGAIAVVWLAGGPMALAMFAAIAVAHRYTADFLPWLVAAAALGAACLEHCGRRARVAGATGLIVATAWSVMLNAAIALHYQGAMVWGTPDGTAARYRALQQRVDRWSGAEKK